MSSDVSVANSSSWTSAVVLDIVPSLDRPASCMLSLGHYTRIIPENETRAWDSTLKSLPYHKPYQQPHPPIGVAASSPQSGSIRMAGERGWIPMSSALLARPYLNGQWQFVEDGAQSAGRVANQREWRIARDIFVGPTPAVARQRAIDNCVNILMDLETGF